MSNYQYASNGEIEIRIDLSKRESQVQYRLLTAHEPENKRWNGTSFQAADFVTSSDALLHVWAWLGGDEES
jgi:hypothetical protein